MNAAELKNTNQHAKSVGLQKANSELSEKEIRIASPIYNSHKKSNT
jgi:hypothetical protein